MAVNLLGPKFSTFTLNNMGDQSVSTKDSWFVNTWDRHLGMPRFALDKKKGTYSVEATPRNNAERVVQERVVRKVANRFGLQPAEIQAIMWGYEQRLYRKLGSQTPTEDYTYAAKKIVEKLYGEDEAIAAERATSDGPFFSPLETLQTKRGSLTIDEARQPEFEFGKQYLLTGGQSERSSERQSNPNNPFLTPTREEVAQKQPIAQAMFEVGKPGSEYENGLTLNDAALVAGALGYYFKLVKNRTEMDKEIGKIFDNPNYKSKEFMAGVRTRMPDLRDDSKNAIIVIKPGLKVRKGLTNQDIDEPDALRTALHEIGHALEYNILDKSKPINQLNTFTGMPGGQAGEFNVAKQRTYDVVTDEFATDVNLGTEAMDTNTLRAAFADIISEGFKKIPDKEANKVFRELVRNQRNRIVSGRNPNFRPVAVRPPYDEADAGLKIVADGLETGEFDTARATLARTEMNNYMKNLEFTYFHTVSELLGDAIGNYLYNPKDFKNSNPETTKLIQKFLNNADSSKVVKFYSMPVASILAYIMASMAFQPGDEEEEQDPGMLTSMGALSA